MLIASAGGTQFQLIICIWIHILLIHIYGFFTWQHVAYVIYNCMVMQCVRIQLRSLSPLHFYSVCRDFYCFFFVSRVLATAYILLYSLLISFFHPFYCSFFIALLFPFFRPPIHHRDFYSRAMTGARWNAGECHIHL